MIDVKIWREIVNNFFDRVVYVPPKIPPKILFSPTQNPGNKTLEVKLLQAKIQVFAGYCVMIQVSL